MREKDAVDTSDVVSKNFASDSFDLVDESDIMKWIISEEIGYSANVLLSSERLTNGSQSVAALNYDSSIGRAEKRPSSGEIESLCSKTNRKKKRKGMSNSESLEREDVNFCVEGTNVLSDLKLNQEIMRSTERSICLRFAPQSENVHRECGRPIAEEPLISEQEKYVLQIQRVMIIDQDGDRPIHIAVAQENIRLVRRICSIMKSIGASLDPMNNLRQTPLHLAVIIQNLEIVKFLLMNGSSVQKQDRQGRTPLHLSVHFFHEKCFKILLNHHCSKLILDSLDYEGLSVLHYAVKKRNTSIINDLYQAGANIDIVDGKSGRSALMYAILINDMNLVQLILKCGGSIDKMDYSGQSALDIANLVENKEIVQLLEKGTMKE